MRKFIMAVFGVRLAANEQDPGTGESFDFKKMVHSLLGLKDDADKSSIETAYNCAMASDVGDSVIRSKVANLQKANEQAQEKLTGAEQLAANEKKARETAEARVKELEGEVTTLKSNFANERQARIELFTDNLIRDGKITKAEKESTVKTIANAADLAAEFETWNKKAKVIHTTTGTENLGSERSQGVKAAEEFANEVARVQKDEHLDYMKAWDKVAKTDKGKALLAGMHQPEKPAVAAK